MSESDTSKPISESENQNKPDDVLAILKGLNVLKGNTPEEIPRDKTVADDFLAVVKDPVNASTCVSQLFPNGIPLDHSFYHRLDSFHHWIGIASSGDEAIGIIWSEAMRRLDPVDKQQLLHIFTTQPGPDFFKNSGSLYIVVKDHSFPADFLANWFVEILKIVERDVQNDLWITISTLCTYHSDLALDVLWALSTPPDSRRLNIAGFILGSLRSVSLGKYQSDEFGRIEAFYKDHAENEFRAVYYFSWVTSARNDGITLEQLKFLFDRATNSHEDLDIIVCVICRIITVVNLHADLAHYCCEWINTHISSLLSPDAKYHVVFTAEHIVKKNDQSTLSDADVSKWILSIQPVLEENLGTWERIADYLCTLLKRDPRQFRDVFVCLCTTSAGTIHQLMSKRHLQHFAQVMHNSDVGEVIGQLAVSTDKATRRLGLYLFNELEIAVFPQSAFESDSELKSRLLFYETQLTFLKPKSFARILIALIPFAENSTDSFRDDLYDEIMLQLNNYSGEFRAEFDLLAKDTPMVKKALEEIACYFIDLKQAHEVGINLMDVAGYQRAIMQYNRMFSRKMHEAAKSFSVFMQKVKHVQLLYGQSTSQFIDSQLHTEMPLGHTSTSMEIPFIEICDPEQMAHRRFHAADSIKALTAQYNKQNSSEGASDE